MGSKGITPGAGGGVKEGEMQWPKKGDMNYNLNTILLGFTIVSGFSWAILQWADQKSADRATQEWIARHELLHKERQVAYEGTVTALRTELNQVKEETRKLENLNYRITVAEQAGINIQKVLESLQTTVATLAADVRVTRTIIETEGLPVTPRRRGQRIDN